MENSADHPLLHIPKYLADWPAWAAWTAPVKMPLDLRRGLRKAAVDLPESWAGWPAATAYLAKAARYRPPALPLTMGVGILVAPPLVFIDFDDMLPEDPDDEEAAPPDWAEAFLQRAADLGAYTEWSGSGTGAHALVRVTPSFPTLTRNRYTRGGPRGAVGIELYSGKRFAAMTGFPYFPGVRPTLNEPKAGDDFLAAFIADLGVSGAPILSQPLGPISVPPPSEKVVQLASELSLLPDVARAFADPQREYADFAVRREKKSMDSSLSAWRFYLYSVAARNCPTSPLPLYELFHPKKPEGRPSVEEWQAFSGYLKKKHRVYADIQRAHALIVEEARLLALDLGEPPPPPASRTAAPRHVVNEDLIQSWAQLGLVMKITKNSAVPVSGSANYALCIAKHHHFGQWRIERNLLDGSTRVNRQPLQDTLATRFLEPLRSILDMPSDPPVQAVRDAIEVVADDAPFDPLIEYLEGLPAYDINSEESLLSTWLQKIGATVDQDTEKYSRRILLGLVARALKPGIKFDYVPVLEGPTGIGKSSLVSMLVTDPYFAVLSQDLQGKDAKIALRGKWGLELAEMSAFKKSDEESRKAFFSTAFDSFRPPYGRASIDVYRRCVLFGTTEDKQYLSDWRGNRRYWPVRFDDELDLKWFQKHRDRLFAEAVHYFKAGERFHDTHEEMHDPGRLAALESRLVTPAWQSRLIEHLESLPGPEAPGEIEELPGRSGLIRTLDIAAMQKLLDLPPAVQNMSDAQLAHFLRRAGYHSVTLSFRHDGRSQKAYYWGHSALLRLTMEQQRAFFSLFPNLFPGAVSPLPWVNARVEHLPGALRHLTRIE